MNTIKYTLLVLVIIVAMISVEGCFLFRGIDEKDGEIIVRGENVITNETMTIQPGTKVTFKDQHYAILGKITSKIVIGNGAKLIAQGTAEEPIDFVVESQLPGDIRIEFTENADGENSIIDHCTFVEQLMIRVDSSVTIQYCKFENNIIYCYKSASPIIQYNNIKRTNNYFSSLTIIRETDEDMPTPIIKYNNIEKGFSGIKIVYSPGIIENNNITGTSSYAINGNSSTENISINNNYIANCNGKSGVDTDGSQCINISYNTYCSTPIAEAGCGW